MNLLVSMIGNQWGVPDTGGVSKKNFVLQFLFNKDVGLRPATLLKKRLQERCFPVNFEKKYKSTFFTEHLQATASTDEYVALSFTILYFYKLS